MFGPRVLVRRARHSCVVVVVGGLQNEPTSRTPLVHSNATRRRIVPDAIEIPNTSE